MRMVSLSGLPKAPLVEAPASTAWNSQSPFRLVKEERTICGLGYSKIVLTLSGVIFLPHSVMMSVLSAPPSGCGRARRH